MTKTQLAVLWGLGALFVAVLGALGFLLSQADRPEALTAPAANSAISPATVVHRLPQTPNSAQHLYVYAMQAAQAWQPDAALAGAATSWPFVSLDALSRPVDWTFQFYSPATELVYVVNVSGTSATTIRETRAPYRLSTIDDEKWRVDSYQALNIWLNHGGGEFLRRYPVVDISIRLGLSQAQTPVWTVLGIDDTGQAVLTEQVDAYDGMVQ
jgi:hypothetical protein